MGEGRNHLGAIIGTSTLTESYVQEKLSGSVKDMERLADIAATRHMQLTQHSPMDSQASGPSTDHPSDITDLLQPLEDTI